MIVADDKVFAVFDHDFTKFSIVPSVTMLINIQESLGTWDMCMLGPSSPLKHIAELKQILLDEDLLSEPILCLNSETLQWF